MSVKKPVIRSSQRWTTFAIVHVALGVSIAQAHEPLILGDPPTETPAHHAGLIAAADGSVETYYLRSGESRQEIAMRRTTDAGKTWSAPSVVTALPGGRVEPLHPGEWFTVRPLIAKDGELHFIVLRIRNLNGRAGLNQFIDAWYLGSRLGRTRWQEPNILYKGMVGPPRSLIQLPSGRIVYPFDHALPDRDSNYPTGAGEILCVYSDDDGDSWQFSSSKLTAPVDRIARSPNYGALEPVLMPLKDGRLWMLLRTPYGRLYESFSRDGSEWTPPQPSRFYSSNSPATLVRLRDGRIVIFWNNCQNAPTIDGSEPYTNRDVLHAAISSDEGATWQGYREIYRSSRRNEDPPREGTSFGAAYPDAAVTKDNKILVMTGHGEKNARLIEVDPDWLQQTHHQSDFSKGLDEWCVYKGIGPIETFWRARIVGASLVEFPEKTGTKALRVYRPKGEPADGAVWNFPMGRKGVLTLRMKLQPNFGGASIALADRYYDPTDIAGEKQAVFDLRISAFRQLMSGPAIEADRWYTITLAWNLDDKSCRVQVDGQEFARLDQINPESEGACYLRLRSLAQSPDDGFLVESVNADVGNDVSN